MYRHIGLVPERETVHAYLTGREFARLNARLQGVADPDAAAARAIATVDLTDAADRPIGTYSKGMRQRAKLAGALVHDPSILLLDEPFNGMDPRQRLHMMTLLRSMAAAGRTILFSSHILEEVERLADSVLVVYAGRLAAAGDFRSIRRLMTDRPHTFTVRSSDDRRLAVGADGRRVGVRRGAGRRPGRHPDRRLRGLHPGPAADRARDQRSRCSRWPRPTTRSRASSATWCADDRHGAARSTSRCGACSAAAGRCCSSCSSASRC